MVVNKQELDGFIHQLCGKAKEIVTRLGVLNFEGTNGWLRINVTVHIYDDNTSRTLY